MNHDHKIEKSEIPARDLNEMMKEMMPFLVYTAIPIVITIAIAYFFGTTAQH